MKRIVVSKTTDPSVFLNWRYAAWDDTQPDQVAKLEEWKAKALAYDPTEQFIYGDTDTQAPTAVSDKDLMDELCLPLINRTGLDGALLLLDLVEPPLMRRAFVVGTLPLDTQKEFTELSFRAVNKECLAADCPKSSYLALLILLCNGFPATAVRTLHTELQIPVGL